MISERTKNKQDKIIIKQPIMSRIFISYKRVDKEKVFKIKDQIESALGEKCWIDFKGLYE